LRVENQTPRYVFALPFGTDDVQLFPGRTFFIQVGFSR